MKNFTSELPKIYNKNIEKDLIVDVCLSPEKKTVYCANKNSKKILYYTLEKIDSKLKLIKQENKSIQCERPYEISSIVCDNSGSLICTIGTNDDTEIQIFEPLSSELKFKQSTSAIKNIQLLMGPNDNNLLISTYMNDISVFNLEKSDKLEEIFPLINHLSNFIQLNENQNIIINDYILYLNKLKQILKIT